MTIRDIAVHIDQSLSINGRIDAAGRLATHLGAKIRGVYTIPPNPLSLYMDKLSTVSESAATPYMTGQLQIAAEIKDRFVARLAKQDIVPQWTQTQGFFTDVLVKEFRYADVGVIGQPDENEMSEPSNRFINSLLIQTGTPQLSIPRTGWDKPIGLRPIVAWDEERESALALSSAIGMLSKAEDVLVVTAGDDVDTTKAMAERCCERLSRHGIEAQPFGIKCEVYDEPQELLKFASNRDADLLVMGAWGHSRIKQAIMGGVTQTMLRSTVLPLWLMH